MLGKPLAVLLLAQLLCSVNAIARPSVFWFNDPVAPDEAVLVTGADLDSVTAIKIARVADASAAAAGDTERAVAILQPNPLSLKFVIPKEFAPGIYRFTLAYADGEVSARVNLPTVYWVQGNLGDAVSPGGWIQVFGRNIVRRPASARLVLLPEGGGVPVTTTVSDGGMWRASFRTSETVAAGSYRMRLSNGDGGDDEWVEAGRIQIRAAAPEPRQIFDVRSYGAVGDGKVNATRAFAAAMDAARRNGGGTVYIPDGRYLFSDTLVIPPGVTLKGERTDLVNLVWPDFADPPDMLIKGTTQFSLEDLTIYASNHRHVVSGGFLDGNVPVPNASDIAVKRVRIRASAFRGFMNAEATYRRMADLERRYPNSAPNTVRLSGDHLEVSDCDILGSGSALHLFKASNAIVSGNLLSNGRNGLYSITGSRRVIFENNVVTAVDLQGTGGGITTVSNQVSASENVFVGGNTFKGVYGLDREGITSDGPGGFYYGHAQSAAPDRLLLLDAWQGHPVSPDWTGAAVMVVAGHGAGQYARVTALASAAAPAPKAISLDRPLQIGLDATSVITVVQAQQNYLIIGNTFEDTGIAAQSYGTALGHVIAGNRSIRSSGFFAIGLFYAHFQPSWQVQILDNRIIEGNAYRAGPHREALSDEAAVGVHAYQTEQNAGAPPLARAIIVRGNRLEHDSHLEIKGFYPASPGVRDVIVEANTVGPSRVGMFVDYGVAWWLDRRNVVQPRIMK